MMDGYRPYVPVYSPFEGYATQAHNLVSMLKVIRRYHVAYFPMGLPGMMTPAMLNEIREQSTGVSGRSLVHHTYNSVRTFNPMVVLLTAVMIPIGARKTPATTIASTSIHIGVCSGLVSTKTTGKDRA
jgi:hypothetical protein